MTTYCFHHTDNDGKAAGAIVYRGWMGTERPVMIPIDYGFPFPWTQLQPEDTVVMVDYSLQPFSEMVRLSQTVSRFTWIDHHKSAIEEYQKARQRGEAENIDAYLEVGRAGCELTWEYFTFRRPTPLAVTLLGRYDVFDLDYSNKVLPFQYGMRAVEHTDPTDSIWNILLNVDGKHDYLDTLAVIDNICSDGQVVERYSKISNEVYCKSRAFTTTFEGLRAIACNKGLSGSKLFDSVWDPEKYDIMILFSRLPTKKWTVSFYTTKPEVDCSALAKKYGGGGHHSAGGCECDCLPFEH